MMRILAGRGLAGAALGEAAAFGEVGGAEAAGEVLAAHPRPQPPRVRAFASVAVLTLLRGVLRVLGRRQRMVTGGRDQGDRGANTKARGAASRSFAASRARSGVSFGDGGGPGGYTTPGFGTYVVIGFFRVLEILPSRTMTGSGGSSRYQSRATASAARTRHLPQELPANRAAGRLRRRPGDGAARTRTSAQPNGSSAGGSRANRRRGCESTRSPTSRAPTPLSQSGRPFFPGTTL